MEKEVEDLKWLCKKKEAENHVLRFGKAVPEETFELANKTLAIKPEEKQYNEKEEGND